MEKGVSFGALGSLDIIVSCNLSCLEDSILDSNKLEVFTIVFLEPAKVLLNEFKE